MPLPVRPLVLGALVILAGVQGLAANDEQALRERFAGAPVVVLVDLPATTSGLDLYPRRDPQFDGGEHQRRLLDSGIGAYRGDVLHVTQINVKGKHIEFHLGAGGSSQRPRKQSHYAGANQLTRELERQLDAAQTEAEKRRIRARLAAERDRLGREQDVMNAVYEEQYQRALAERTAEEWDLMAGSRINIRFDDRVPADTLTPEGLMRDLEGFIEFDVDPAAVSAGPGQPPAGDALGADWFAVRKGLTIDEVEARLGASTECEAQSQGALEVTVCRFDSEEATLEASFVGDVLVRYVLTSN